MPRSSSAATGCDSWYQSQRILQKKYPKKIPKFFNQFEFPEAMDVSKRPTVAELATDVVTLNTLDQTLTWWKQINELLKSTSESLARIGRVNSPQRLLDPRPRRLEAAMQEV
jgi:hypothetical protein